MYSCSEDEADMFIKPWRLSLLCAVVVVAIGAIVLDALIPIPLIPHSGLIRTPDSAYKYHLCEEAFAFNHATANNPYKTDYTFRDPFRNADDTIVPYLLRYDLSTHTVDFSVDVVIDQVATFHESIVHVHELDGISVVLPNGHNQSEHSGVPQFIVSSFGNGNIAVLDYTCPEQWVWSA
jgi:hypothetical protein